MPVRLVCLSKAHSWGKMKENQYFENKYLVSGTELTGSTVKFKE